MNQPSPDPILDSGRVGVFSKEPTQRPSSYKRTASLYNPKLVSLPRASDYACVSCTGGASGAGGSSGAGSCTGGASWIGSGSEAGVSSCAGAGTSAGGASWAGTASWAGAVGCAGAASCVPLCTAVSTGQLVSDVPSSWLSSKYHTPSRYPWVPAYRAPS